VGQTPKSTNPLLEQLLASSNRNGLGNYIDKADPKDQYSCARICVEVNLEVGLPEAIKLKVGEWQHFQKLDYEQLSFKCRGCHEYGHFQRNCPKEPSMVKDTNDGWQQVGRARSHTKTKGPRSEKMAQAYQAELEPNRDTRNSGMETESERTNEATEVATQQSNIHHQYIAAIHFPHKRGLPSREKTLT
jgi:hypothetical protein